MKYEEKTLNLKTLTPEDSHDRLVYGITHDFNNLITQIYTNLEVALLDKELKGETKSTIENAISSLDQAVELLEKLKTISRPISTREFYINPVLALGDLIKKIEGTSNLKFSIQNLVKNDISVKIDKSSFNRVIENIIDNAIYACSFSEKPEIFIFISSSENELSIVIEDSGEGIPNHLASFIFNPYFTTKKNDIGSGVGLSISKTLIVAAGGSLELSPKKQQLNGASFTIKLPLSTTPPSIDYTEATVTPEDLAAKNLYICAEDKIIKNHLFILNKLKANCHHFTTETLASTNFDRAQIVIVSLSEEVVKYGIVRFIKIIPPQLPIIVISPDLESSSYLNELQRPLLHILDLPITFNIFAKTILKLINTEKL